VDDDGASDTTVIDLPEEYEPPNKKQLRCSARKRASDCNVTATAPAKLTPAPAKLTPALAKLTPAPAKVMPTPAKLTPAPVKITPALAKLAPAPAKLAPAPITKPQSFEEDLILTSNVGYPRRSLRKVIEESKKDAEIAPTPRGRPKGSRSGSPAIIDGTKKSRGRKSLASRVVEIRQESEEGDTRDSTSVVSDSTTPSNDRFTRCQEDVGEDATVSYDVGTISSAPALNDDDKTVPHDGIDSSENSVESRHSDCNIGDGPNDKSFNSLGDVSAYRSPAVRNLNVILGGVGVDLSNKNIIPSNDTTTFNDTTTSCQVSVSREAYGVTPSSDTTGQSSVNISTCVNDGCNENTSLVIDPSANAALSENSSECDIGADIDDRTSSCLLGKRKRENDDLVPESQPLERSATMSVDNLAPSISAAVIVENDVTNINCGILAPTLNKLRSKLTRMPGEASLSREEGAREEDARGEGAESIPPWEGNNCQTDMQSNESNKCLDVTRALTESVSNFSGSETVEKYGSCDEVEGADSRGNFLRNKKIHSFEFDSVPFVELSSNFTDAGNNISDVGNDHASLGNRRLSADKDCKINEYENDATTSSACKTDMALPPSHIHALDTDVLPSGACISGDSVKRENPDCESSSFCGASCSEIKTEMKYEVCGCKSELNKMDEKYVNEIKTDITSNVFPEMDIKVMTSSDTRLNVFAEEDEGDQKSEVKMDVSEGDGVIKAEDGLTKAEDGVTKTEEMFDTAEDGAEESDSEELVRCRIVFFICMCNM